MNDPEAKFQLASCKSLSNAGRAAANSTCWLGTAHVLAHYLRYVFTRGIHGQRSAVCLPAFHHSSSETRIQLGKGQGRETPRCDERTNPSSEEEVILHFFFCASFTVNKELRKIAENVSIQTEAEFAANFFGMVSEEGKVFLQGHYNKQQVV